NQACAGSPLPTSTHWPGALDAANAGVPAKPACTKYQPNDRPCSSQLPVLVVPVVLVLVLVLVLVSEAVQVCWLLSGKVVPTTTLPDGACEPLCAVTDTWTWSTGGIPGSTGSKVVPVMAVDVATAESAYAVPGKSSAVPVKLPAMTSADN